MLTSEGVRAKTATTSTIYKRRINLIIIVNISVRKSEYSVDIVIHGTFERIIWWPNLRLKRVPIRFLGVWKRSLCGVIFLQKNIYLQNRCTVAQNLLLLCLHWK